MNSNKGATRGAWHDYKQERQRIEMSTSSGRGRSWHHATVHTTLRPPRGIPGGPFISLSQWDEASAVIVTNWNWKLVVTAVVCRTLCGPYGEFGMKCCYSNRISQQFKRSSFWSPSELLWRGKRKNEDEAATRMRHWYQSKFIRNIRIELHWTPMAEKTTGCQCQRVIERILQSRFRPSRISFYWLQLSDRSKSCARHLHQCVFPACDATKETHPEFNVQC